MKRDLLALLEEKVVVFDGAMGTSLQGMGLTADDFGGLDGCNEVLVETRPDAVRQVHDAFLAAGCDVVETDSFGGNRLVLAEYGLAERAGELNRKAAALAREVALGHSTAARPRFVCGSIGPGTRLPSLGQIGFAELRDAFLPQVQGLLEGGADALIIETCQDLLQIKAALEACRLAFAGRGARVPLFVSVTVEASGTMLVGSDLATALAALSPLPIDALGLNCATGPEGMKRHVQLLGRSGPRHLSAMPNAGLPENVGGRVVYPLGPADFAAWVEGFVRDDGIGIVGGCCGTTAEHLRALAARVGGLAAPRRRATRRAEAASLFQAVPLKQEPPPLLVGERTNSNGSKEFRDRLLADDLDGMLAVARAQEEAGAHLLDVCVAYVGRDERADMARLVPELARGLRTPLVIDSTDPAVVEAALERHGGRCVVNSINLEDGPARAEQILELARRFGAAVVALVIDEQGMALTTARKLEVAERLYELAVGQHGLAPQDLIFDLLTFTVASGDEATRGAAQATLEAIVELKRRHPDVLTLLGVSNVSFGLEPTLRRMLNSVFLAEAVARGLDMAIVNTRGILPLHRIEPELQDACRRLLLADSSGGDPLARLLELAGYAAAAELPDETGEATASGLDDAEQLRRNVVHGVKQGLPALLDRLVAAGHEPLSLVNGVLIPAMQKVGELFGSGQMQLPFVLQSAEVMKAAVRHLEPLLAAGGGAGERGTLVLATVKGDVHDIGKNLVDIILSNNGYRVVNLGIKVGIEQMLQAAAAERADALGMSGLLVKSTVVMKENLEEMVRRGVRLPVLLGGAALTRSNVEGELRAIYGPDVHYGEDAFAALRLLEGICGKQAAAGGQPAAGASGAAGPALPPSATGAAAAASPATQAQAAASSGRQPSDPALPGDEPPTAAQPDDLPDHRLPVPRPPYLGARLVEEIPLEQIYPLLNEATLFRGQWRYRRGQLERDAYRRLIEEQVRPAFERLKAYCRDEGVLRPRAVVGYFHCHAEDRTVVVHDPASPGRESVRFQFPRQRIPPHRCIADYFRPGPTDEPDLLGLLVVTVGEEASRRERALFAAGDYREYLHLHGLAVEVAEATTEWLHAQMRRELGIAADDQPGLRALVRQGYRGSRYSFGYPACPDLSQQVQLFSLLQPERIGVRLTETFQMVPEQSVSAVVVHHPAARYFSIDGPVPLEVGR